MGFFIYHYFCLQEISARTNATINYLSATQINGSVFWFKKIEEIIHIYEETRDKTNSDLNQYMPKLLA